MAAVARRSRANRPMRRISGPAAARQTLPIPISSSRPRLVADMNSPHTLRRGKAALLDQRDAAPGARQPDGRRTARRPGADHDDVELPGGVFTRHLLLSRHPQRTNG